MKTSVIPEELAAWREKAVSCLTGPTAFDPAFEEWEHLQCLKILRLLDEVDRLRALLEPALSALECSTGYIAAALNGTP